jgi:hypothetical protein
LFHQTFTNIPKHGTSASSRKTKDTALTESCHPACNKHRPGTKRIILSHRKFTNIPEHGTSASCRQTKDAALTEICHLACKTEICHPACNNHRTGTKKINLPHQKFTNIPERGTLASSQHTKDTALTEICHPACKTENNHGNGRTTVSNGIVPTRDELLWYKEQLPSTHMTTGLNG